MNGKRMIALMMSVCLLVCGMLTGAQADGISVNNAGLKMRIATRTGPSTAYTEPGTFFQTTWYKTNVDVISKAYGSGVWWVQVEFEENGKLYRAYTGVKRVNVDLDWVPQESVMGYGVMTAAGDVHGYYGPGSHYTRMSNMVPWCVEGEVIAAENGYVQLDYYDSDLGRQCRAWVPSDLVRVTWYSGYAPESSIPDNLAQIQAGSVYWREDNSNSFCQVMEYRGKGNYSVINLYIPEAGHFSNVYVYMDSRDHGTFSLANGAQGEIWFATKVIAVECYMPQYGIDGVLVFGR